MDLINYDITVFKIIFTKQAKLLPYMFSTFCLMVKNKHNCQKKLKSVQLAFSIPSLLLALLPTLVLIPPCLWEHPPLPSPTSPSVPCTPSEWTGPAPHHWYWPWAHGFLLLRQSRIGLAVTLMCSQRGRKGFVPSCHPTAKCSRHICSVSDRSKEQGSHPLNGTLSLHAGPRSPGKHCNC